MRIEDIIGQVAIALTATTDKDAMAQRIKAAIGDNEQGRRKAQDEPPPRAYNRAQIAALMGCNRKTVTAYARRGLLVPIYSGAGGKRAQGYTGESVAALLSGKVSARG